ncbi:CU044_5270 family protein [Streptomyces neyagawaensis]|uniref:CU044_5270 family protein n=1 Tax=Streptomyces neyagawaensis TaxID=42238 RepID=UPI0006E34751|nr:CU044_5270 family protein [Streptomyces neyagawaensis]MCL6737335.1 CU044_5270 family protein [Streptomyces neyagawaensis]MDE1681709.1 CU044_5270 family protein [Streptomyces neyagawaensis]
MRDIDDPRDLRDLRDLTDFDAGTPPLDDETRRRGRARLLAAITPPDTDRAGNRTARTGVVSRRPLLRVALTGAVAAAVAAGVLVAVQDDDADRGRTAHPRVTSLPPMRNVSARTVLDGAAAYEREHEKTVSPRDDQFVYTKEIIKETDQRTGRTKTHVDENWRSVDGSKRSWIMEIGKGWWSPPLADDESSWPPQDWGRLRKLPTDPEKLILAIRADFFGGGEKNTSLEKITDQEWSHIHFSLAGLLKLVPVMPEGLRPAAYEALGMVPGVKAVPNQKDAKGRVGVAITYDDPTLPEGSSSFGGYFIFDPVTYRFLGCRDERTSGGGKDMKGYTQLSYLDSWAIVDRAKQRPVAAG